MARKPKQASPSDLDHVPSDHDHENFAKGDDANLKGSPRGDSPPRSPSPEVQLNDSIPTHPPSPFHTSVPISIAPLPPPTTSQPTSTAPLPPPIFTQTTSTTTNTPEPTVHVNVFDTGEPTSETETPVISKTISLSPLTDSFPILGGDELEFESYYYSPYRVQSDDDDDDDAPLTK
ncbi:extensin-like [Lactuca sativa]|uniref:extensin-like n=1 Tax=Lactuca sativa TaxID=4236 RepID=UPI000CD7FC85|nr:extensin-like [Lactuca sativa]